MSTREGKLKICSSYPCWVSCCGENGMISLAHKGDFNASLFVVVKREVETGLVDIRLSFPPQKTKL